MNNNNLIPVLTIIAVALSILIIWFGFDREMTRDVYVEYLQNHDFERTINECAFKINCNHYNDLLWSIKK